MEGELVRAVLDVAVAVLSYLFGRKRGKTRGRAKEKMQR
jgi:hypothetical protein